MQIKEFKQIVKTFSDPGSEIPFDKSEAMIQINGEVIPFRIAQQGGDITIIENDKSMPASQWIVHRLANLKLLATRLKEYLINDPNFVTPAGTYLPSVDKNPGDSEEIVDDTVTKIIAELDNRSPLETSITYITSDAGEGKTSLIHAISILQANRFYKGESDWLLVPIPLGGKHFLRFDDITIGALQNRYRFPFLYYASFLELVKMGIIVPAFDGFEEMFVENSTGEGLSAMGQIIKSLDSQGTILVAARKAYFEFESLKAKEKLFDNIRDYSVSFSKLQLSRWNHEKFTEYCSKRNIKDSLDIYKKISERLGVDHPLLTRAVLVKHLLDIVDSSESIEQLLIKMAASEHDFYYIFIRGIIKREAELKWTDRSGHNDVGEPLLSIDEHIELLSMIAMSTWENRVDYLKRDVLQFVSDYYCETTKKSTLQTQQIRERIRLHALLIPSKNSPDSIEFDHEEFRLFFLGESVAQLLKRPSDIAKAELLSILRRGILPGGALKAICDSIRREKGVDRHGIIQLIMEVSRLDNLASYTQSNCANLLVLLINGVQSLDIVISDMTFDVEPFRDKQFSDIKFNKCYFIYSSLENATFNNCSFDNCKFGQIRVYKTSNFVRTNFNNYEIESIKLVDRNVEIRKPAEIKVALQGLGIHVDGALASDLRDVEVDAVDDFLMDFEKILRYFNRSTHISESIIKIRLGARGNIFVSDAIPILIDSHIIIEIDNHGGGQQRRFKLGMHLSDIYYALDSCGGKFQAFNSLCIAKNKS